MFQNGWQNCLAVCNVKQRQSPFLLLLILITVAGSLGVFVWGLNKAFDLTDAGYYLLRCQDRQPLEAGGFLYDHILLRAVLPSAWRQIIPMRFIGMVLNLLSTLLFAFAIFHTQKKREPGSFSFPAIFWLIFTGFIFSYAGSPSELSYNILNQFLLLCGAAFLLLSFHSRVTPKLVFSALAGSLLGISLLIKLPSGLAASVASAALLLFSGKKRWSAVFSLGAGILSSLLLIYFFVKPDFITYFVSGISSIGKGNEYGSHLLLISLYNILLQNVIAFIIALAVNLAWWFTNKIEQRKLKLLTRTAIAIIPLLILGKAVVKHLQGSMIVSDTLMLMVFLIVLRLVFQKAGSSKSFSLTSAAPGSRLKTPPLKECISYYHNNYLSLAPIIFLFILPYIGALGTNNSLNWGAKFYYAFILGALALLSARQNSRLLRTTLFGMAAYMMIIGLLQVVQYPYRVKPLYTQKYEYKGIKFDAAKLRFLQETDSALNSNGFRPEQGMIVAYKSPGLVYLLNSYQPGGVLWSPETEDAYFTLLSKTPILQKPAIIAIGKPLSHNFTDKLQAATGISFFANYHLVKKISFYEAGSLVYLYLPL